MDDQQNLVNNLLFGFWPQLGPAKQLQLRNRLGTAEAVFCYLLQSDLPNELQVLQKQVAAWQQPNNPMRLWAEQEIVRCQDAGIEIISFDSPDYPALLKEISTPPSVLYVQGDKHLLHASQLAIVGARKASQQGLLYAKTWAQEISQAGVVITSGMAEGIDAAAHLGALAADAPTIAVLAHGLDITYPKKHGQLKQQIIDTGLIVSEFCLGQEPKRSHFPQRNRIISGLSEAVLMVEAAIKSGSLITARCAIEQNRELFAIPWAIADTQSAGGNYLIQQGAHLAHNSAYILDALNWHHNAHSKQTSLTLSDADQALLLVPFQFTAIDELATILNLSVSELSQRLLQWEMQALVEAQAGCYRRLA